MAIKVVSLFLIGMLLLAMFGRLRVGGKGGPSSTRRKTGTKTLEAHKCPRCGSFVLGDGPCPCEERNQG